MKAYDAIGRNNWDKSKFQIGCENRMFLNFQFFPKHAGLQANLNFQLFWQTNFWNLRSSACTTCHTIIKMIWDNFYMLRQLISTFLCVWGQQAHFKSSSLEDLGIFEKIFFCLFYRSFIFFAVPDVLQY